MKRWALALVLAGASLWLWAPGFSQEDMVTVDTNPFERPQRAPALFTHDAHNEKAGIDNCNECHHVYRDGKKVEDESSEGRALRRLPRPKGAGPCALPDHRLPYELQGLPPRTAEGAGDVRAMSCLAAERGRGCRQ